MMVHPGVYGTVGLPTWATWKAANQTAVRAELRRAAARPVLAAMVETGVFTPGRIPKGWRRLCGVNRRGTPVDA
jgi:hypothetical protein